MSPYTIQWATVFTGTITNIWYFLNLWLCEKVSFWCVAFLSHCQSGIQYLEVSLISSPKQSKGWAKFWRGLWWSRVDRIVVVGRSVLEYRVLVARKWRYRGLCWSTGYCGPEFGGREVCAGVQGAVGKNFAVERSVL